MSLNLTLSTALSGLMTAQSAMDVVSNNITNVNTEGYTRKSFNPETVVLAGQGSGVQISKITRQVEKGVYDDMREAAGLSAQYTVMQTYYSRIQDLFGQPEDSNSLSSLVTDFGNQLEQLGVETDKAPQADNVVAAGAALADKLAYMSSQLQTLRTDADQAIANKVSQVNTILSNLDALNDKISLAFTNGGSPDLLDQRDNELTKLTKLIDISYYERESGAVSIFTKGGTTLLDSAAKSVSHNGLSSVQAWDSEGGGDFDGIMVGTTDITDTIQSGEVRALLDMRDGELVDMQAQLDELAVNIRNEVNQVHNRGTSYPAMPSSYSGTRSFIDPANQQFSINDPTADTAIVLFNSDGTQKAVTTLKTLMTDGDTTTNDVGPFTLADMASKLQDWLNSSTGGGMSGATAAFDSSGHFNISLNASSYGLSFRDQTTSVPGAETSDLPISFDPTGLADSFSTYETAEGFSNFFGLNDFFTNGGHANWQWQTQVLPEGYTQFGSTTLNMYTTDDDGNAVHYGVMFADGDDLETIATRINNDETLQSKFAVKASVVKEGDGYRLSLRALSGRELCVTGSGANDKNFAALGMESAASGQSTWLQVNDTLQLRPDRVSHGITQYNSDTGEFYVSSGDNTNINDLAEVFTQSQTFRTAGGLTTGTLSLSDYAGSVIASASSRAAQMDSQATYQTGLSSALEQKNSEISGVNLDEELARLIVYQQSYAAAARVISTTKEMLEVLTDLAR